MILPGGKFGINFTLTIHLFPLGPQVVLNGVRSIYAAGAKNGEF